MTFEFAELDKHNPSVALAKEEGGASPVLKND